MLACRDPGDVRSVLGVLGVERYAGVLPRRPRRRERARDDHLRGREARVSLGVARRGRVALRVEERMRLVDALVDDPDLLALARGRERRAPERGGADQLGCAVERRVKGRRRPDFRDAGDARERGDLLRRDDDREAVQGHREPPADERARDRALDPVHDCALLAQHHLHVRDRGRRAQVDAAAADRHGRECVVVPDRLGERRRVQRDDELDGPARGSGGRGSDERRSGTEKEEAPSQGANRTGATMAVRADVAELVDAHGSGPCERKLVEVQVLSSA